MQVQTKKLPKAQIELTVEISLEELKPFLEKAAKKLAFEIKVPGFRPGKANYQVIKQEAGEMAIYQKAVDSLVQKTLFQALEKENIHIVGEPRVNVEKMAPNNPLIYKAILNLLPKVKLGNYKKLKIQKKEIKIKEEEIEQTLKNLQKMQTKEVFIDREARKEDKLVIDMEISKDNIPLEGGQAKNHHLYLNEPYYIPGLPEKLIGTKKGKKHSFSLPFPKDYYQKHLAGKRVDFVITTQSVYRLEPPILDDQFAQSLGKKTLSELRELIKENISREAAIKEEQRVEIKMLEEIMEISRFEELPEDLINAETHKMLHELEDDLYQKNLKFEDYLQSIKKTKEQIILDFIPQAIKRIKTALLCRAVAEEEKINANKEEVDKETEETMKLYPDNPELCEHLRSPSSRQYIENILVNRKTIQFLKKIIIQ